MELQNNVDDTGVHMDQPVVNNNLQEDLLQDVGVPAPPVDWGPQGRLRCNVHQDNIIEGPRRTPGREHPLPQDYPPNPTWGERGELRCDLNLANIVEGPRDCTKRS